MAEQHKWQTTCLECGESYELDTLLDKCPNCKGTRFISHFGQDGPGYFSIKRDNELITAGVHFFCQACLISKPVDDQSPDPRYCQSCFVFLTLEANALPAKARKPDWIPEIADKKAAGVAEDTTLIMSTLTDKKSEVDIIPPVVATRPLIKRGPKHRTLPLDLINQWVGEGMGSKAIAARLKGEGVEVSYKTIQRILSGERLLV